MEITLTWEQLETLKTLIFIVDVAKGKNIKRGESSTDDSSVEWEFEEIKFTIG